MKTKFLSSILAVAALCGSVVFTSCGGGGNDNPGGQEPSTEVVLKADRETAVSGEQWVKFTVSNSGSPVTSQATITNVTTGVEVVDGKWMAESKGEYTFEATVAGKKSNAVKVNVKAASAEFFQHVVMTKFTATWCAPCHKAQPNLDKFVAANPNRLIIIAVHCNDGYSCDDGQTLVNANQPQTNNIPTWYFNFDGSPVMGNNCSIASALRNKVEGVMGNYKVVTGVKAESSISGSTAKITATVKFEEAGEYKLGVCLVEDGLRFDNKPYDHVLRKYSTHPLGSPFESKDIKAGDELSFSFSETINGGWKSSNLSFVVYVYKNVGSGAFVINNGILCPLGDTIPYQHNPAE